MPEELRLPLRLIALVEQVMTGRPLSLDPKEIRGVELDLRVARIRELIPPTTKRCVGRLGPDHPGFARWNARLEEPSRVHLARVRKDDRSD